MDSKRLEGFMQKEDEYATTARGLIDNLHNAGTISHAYANLLRGIQSYTQSVIYGPVQLSLRKVEAVLALRETLKDRDINQKHAAYLGSRFDWHFPVALGARDVTMIDLIYHHPEHRQALLKSIKEFGAEITSVGLDNSLIEFKLDLVDGKERVILRLDNSNVYEYQPPQPLGFVLQLYGPWQKTSKVPIRENIARGMMSDGLILNFDYTHSRFTPDIGLEVVKREGWYLYQITDLGKVIASSSDVAIADRPPEPYLKIQRAIQESRQKRA